ncbi:MAG: phytoene desaturase family protein [Ilumatobacteraceae bacterium]|nr:phytoene desaturase family protein [Ilumatobacteraceae bacterium]
MKAVVVGSGIGGLTTSIRLAAADHHVVVLERNPIVGGKVADLDEAGYRFDLGPTALTLPHLFDDVFRLADTTLADEVELVRLDPQIRCWWPNGSTLDLRDDPVETIAEIERLAPGSGLAWHEFAEHTAKLWETSERTILSAPPGSSLSRVTSPLERARIDARRTLAKASASFFDDERLQQLVNRYATYSGSSPYRAPATLAGAAHIEQAHGVWHVTGGIGRLRDALARVAGSMGVEIRTDVDVGRISVQGGAVAGVELADGGSEPAEIVVSNVDASHLYVDLLPSPKQARQLDKAGPSTSAFVLCAAIRGRTEGIAHHNVFFPLHDRQEFQFLEAGQLAIDQTIHASVSAVTDPGQAPPDSENWCIRVTTPPAIGIDRKLMTAGVLNRLAERGFDLRNRVEFTRTLLPADFDARYRAPGGAIHGTSSNGKRAVFSRPDNVGPVDGLYLVGGSAHPGGGLPFVAAGARIVADLVADRHGDS